MMADPSHKAMLYFLEVLMNTDRALSIAELCARCANKQFTPDMRSCVGSSEESIRTFLLKYPSLFHVDGDLVSSVSLGEIPYNGGGNNSECAQTTPPPPLRPNDVMQRRDSVSSNNSVANVEMHMRHLRSCDSNTTSAMSTCSNSSAAWDFGLETEAVKFFQNRLAKREERWIPVKSLAGHLSQASESIRNCVGPQLNFRKFLSKHTHVFEIQGELVGLKDPFPSAASYFGNGRSLRNERGARPLGLRATRPKSLVMGTSLGFVGELEHVVCGEGLPAMRRSANSRGERDTAHDNTVAHTSAPSTPSGYHNSTEHSVHLHGVSSAVVAAAASCNGIKPLAPISMSANEYKAVMYLRKVLERSKGGSRLEYSALFAHLCRAPELVRNSVGYTQMELEEFIAKHSIFFESVPGSGLVAPRRAAKLSIIITGAHSSDSATRTLSNKKGRIYHVAKLWGIIDLGRHEHVFFDKSIFKHVDDLQRHFKLGEVLYFNAILAPKDSRAKWRATQVWKETDRLLVERMSGDLLARRAGGDGAEAIMVTDCYSNGSNGYDCSVGGGSGLAFSPGLELADDIRFFSDDIDENELKRVLEDNGDVDILSDDDGLSIPSPDMPDSPICGSTGSYGRNLNTHHHVISFAESINNNNNSNVVAGLAPQLFNDGKSGTVIYSSSNSTHNNNKGCSNNNNNNNGSCSPITKENGVNITSTKTSCTIATQTLSTGDIMAMQIFHEDMSRLV